MSITLSQKSSPGWWTHSDLEIFHFPGGEPHVRDKQQMGKAIAQLAVTQATTMDDLFALAGWAEVARSRNEEVWLAMPYLPAARADRGFPRMANLVAWFINNAIAPDKLVALDPHSDFIWDSIGFPIHQKIVMDLPSLVKAGVRDIESYAGIIAPDKGAYERALSVAREFQIPLYTAGKTRDFATGKLTGFHMEDKLPKKGRFLVVDDICDGGGTFVGLGAAIHDEHPDIQLDLWVAHGIFSKTPFVLLDQFEEVYTTDSFFDVAKTYPGKHVRTLPLLPHIHKELNK